MTLYTMVMQERNWIAKNIHYITSQSLVYEPHDRLSHRTLWIIESNVMRCHACSLHRLIVLNRAELDVD